MKLNKDFKVAISKYGRYDTNTENLQLHKYFNNPISVSRYSNY